MHTSAYFARHNTWTFLRRGNSDEIVLEEALAIVLCAVKKAIKTRKIHAPRKPAKKKKYKNE
jgi:hypothetical protein